MHFSLKGDHIHVHKNLAFNMGVVQLVFLFGVNQAANKVKWKNYLATANYVLLLLLLFFNKAFPFTFISR